MSDTPQSQEMPKENTPPEVKAPSPEEEKLAQLKDEVADLYVRKILNKKKGGLVSLGASLGFNLNPMKKRAKDYILQEEIPEGEEDEDMDIQQKFTQDIDAKVKQTKIAVQTSIMSKIPEDGMFSYKQEDLDAMKELLQKTTTEKELTDLKKIIKKGKDPTKEKIQPSVSSPAAEKPTESSVTKVVETGALLGGSLVVLTQADLDILKSEKEKIKADITGDFASIKKVENSQGKLILEWTGETPYIHKDVWDDLITLALLFYQKTGQSLSINSAFRTHAHQEELKKQKKDLAAEPGHSGHETGRSFDINAKDKNDKAIGGVEWFREIAQKCHFKPLKWEDRHFDHESLPKDADRPAIAQALDKEYQEKLAA